jgi:transcriptional regulator with XRE-family HTH domain
MPKRRRGYGLGARIKMVRQWRGLTQQSFAERMDVRKGTVGAWETMAHTPDYEQIIAIARGLKVSLVYLVAGVGTPEVTDDPFSVRIEKGTPVRIAEWQASGTEDPLVMARFPATEADRYARVLDDAMAPELRPGDVSIFRMVSARAWPNPGDFVWAHDRRSGRHFLRQFRAVNDRNRPGVRFELVPLNHLFAVEEDGEAITLAGVHIELSRLYKAVD